MDDIAPVVLPTIGPVGLPHVPHMPPLMYLRPLGPINPPHEPPRQRQEIGRASGLPIYSPSSPPNDLPGWAATCSPHATADVPPPPWAHKSAPRTAAAAARDRKSVGSSDL